jgi:hypothetical protein
VPQNTKDLGQGCGGTHPSVTEMFWTYAGFLVILKSINTATRILDKTVEKHIDVIVDVLDMERARTHAPDLGVQITRQSSQLFFFVRILRHGLGL